MPRGKGTVPAKKQKSSPKHDPQNLTLYIRRVLKEVHPDTGINGEASDLVNNLLLDLLKKLCDNAGIVLSHNKKKTLSSREVMAAVRLVLPGELTKHAVSEGIKSVTRFINAGKKEGRQEQKSGLIFPVARVKTLMRGCMVSCPRISAAAPVYTAAVLEYICAEILELSGNSAREYKRVRIIPRDIMRAIKNDEELSELFKDSVLGGGVIPYMHSAFLPKKKN